MPPLKTLQISWIVCSVLLFLSFLQGVYPSLCAAGNLSASINVKEGDEGSGIVNFSLTNNSSFLVQVLRWNTPLEGAFNSDIFAVTLNGQKIKYIGKLVKRGLVEQSDYITLNPGESTSATAALMDGYDIRETGRYEATFASTVKYNTEDPAVKTKVVQEKILSNTLLLDITVIPKPFAAAKEAATFLSCSAERMTILNNALGEAEKYAQKSFEALQHTAIADQSIAKRYTSWFGSYTVDRFSTALGHFSNIAAAVSNETIEFRCDCNDSYFAYVYPDEPYIIHLCRAYWSAPTVGTDSQAGTLIHEISHFTAVAGTNDHAYGQKNSLALAISNPVDALDNADSHEYFAENSPYLPMTAVYVPTNNFTDAPVTLSVPVYAMGSSVSATKEPGEPAHAGNTGGSSVWLTWTAPATGAVQVSTLGSSFDTVLAVYTGNAVGNLNLIAANDDADSEGNIYQSLVTFSAESGQTYRIAVDGFGGVSGNVYLAVTARFGDTDHDEVIGLTDLLSSLKILVGMPVSVPVYADADIDGDGKIGMSEVLYIMQKVAGLE